MKIRTGPLVLCLAICLISGFQGRQDPLAEKILGAVSKKYKTTAGFTARFRHDSETNSGEARGSVTGTITVSGSRYRLASGHTTLICDGKTVWAADSRSKEVTISDYEPEPGDITPERVYTFYQTGYKYMFMGEVRAKNGIWQALDLEPEDIRKEVSKIRLYVDKKDKSIRKWIVFERGTNDREIFEIVTFRPLLRPDPGDFVFRKADFQGYKVVDLR